MVVSSKGRYALRVMVELAAAAPGEYQPLARISARQGISEKYLEAIFAPLAKAGFVEGQRGKNGGYRLTKPAKDYTVGSILRLTEKTLAPVACMAGGAPACGRAGVCTTRAMWQGLDQLIADYFAGITLEDLAEGRLPAQVRARRQWPKWARCKGQPDHTHRRGGRGRAEQGDAETIQMSASSAKLSAGARQGIRPPSGEPAGERGGPHGAARLCRARPAGPMGRKSARLLTRPAAFAHPVRGPKSARLPAHTVLCAFSRPFFSLSSPLFPPPFALTRAAKPAIIQHGLFASRRTRRGSGKEMYPSG